MGLRVLLADDHKLVLEAVAHSLEKDDDFTVVATTDSIVTTSGRLTPRAAGGFGSHLASLTESSA